MTDEGFVMHPWQRRLGDFSERIGKKTRVRYPLTLVLVLNLAHNQEFMHTVVFILLCVPSSFVLGAAITRWWHQRLEARWAQIRRGYDELKDLDRRWRRQNDGALGAMAAATGEFRAVEDYEKERQEIRRRYGIES